MDKTRELALKALYKIEKQKGYSNIVVDEILKQNKSKLENRDIALISEIVYGVTTWKLTLDEIIKKYSKIKIKKISTWILNILRMGIYQIVFLDKIPKSAAVNESVNLAKRYGHTSSSNFVNAILRKIDKKDYTDLFNIENKKQKISVTTSMPMWIVEKLLEQNTIEETQKVCENLNLRPRLFIRINNLKINKQTLKKELEKRKIKFQDTELEDFLCVKNLRNVEDLDLFKEGFFTIQDLSAGLVAKVLNPQKGEKVLDACSAPGGKTTQIAELMKNSGEILAWDIYDHRIELIKQNAERLGINIIKENIADASILKKEYIKKFDKILLDVPCLGIGAIRRKPDIKWQREEKNIQEISKLQFKILNTCAKYLKPNGELVYSTCSILKEENQDIIEKFLNENNEFSYTDYKEINIYNVIKEFIQEKGCINILPRIEL